MALIDKDKVVAEINRVLNSYDPNEITSGRYALVNLRNFLDTLEVKEVDLDEEFENFVVDDPVIGNLVNFNAAKIIAKHFFELGLKAKGEIYVVTRSEEHSDYVEAVFLSESKAEEYCKPYNQDENCYARNITKIKIQ